MLGKDLTLWRSNVSTRHKKQEVCVEQLKQIERESASEFQYLPIIYFNLLHMFENNNDQRSLRSLSWVAARFGAKSCAVKATSVMLGPAALPCLPSVWAKTALWVSLDPADLPSMLTLRGETKLVNIPNISGVLENGWTLSTLSL